MTTTLRTLLVVASIITVIWILRQIRKLRVKMEDAIFWIFFAGILLILAIFPEISFRLSRLLGFMSPANLIFIVVIFLLMEKVFTLSIVVSQLEEKVVILSAEIALRSQAANKRIDREKILTEEMPSETEPVCKKNKAEIKDECFKKS